MSADEQEIALGMEKMFLFFSFFNTSCSVHIFLTILHKGDLSDPDLKYLFMLCQKMKVCRYIVICLFNEYLDTP